MNEACQFLNSWKVQTIEVLTDNRGVQVTMSVDGRDPIHFRTKRFGIGRRGPRSAALAKFCDQAGYGNAEELFDHFAALPRTFVGNLFPFGPDKHRRRPRLGLRCVWPDGTSA
jgi:hypothetical protein